MTTDIFDETFIETSAAPEPEKAPSITGMTVEEMLGTFTGFDHIAIPKAFGASLTKLPGEMAIYVLLFVWHRHSGMADAEAYEKACGTPTTEAKAFFEDDDEISPDAPTTESGKD